MENKGLQVDMKNYIDKYISFIADIVKIINIENACWIRGESTYSRDLAIRLMMNEEHLDYSILDEFAKFELEMSTVFGMSDKDLAIYIKSVLEGRKINVIKRYKEDRCDRYYNSHEWNVLIDSIEYLNEHKIDIQQQR